MSALVGILAGAAGAAAGYALARRRWEQPMRELERGVRAWAEGDLAASLDTVRLGKRGELAALFEQARDQQFKALGERRREASRERERLESLIRNIPDGLLLCNLRGDVLHINSAAIEILGLPADKPLEAANTPAVRMKIQEILKTRTHTETLEIPLQKGAGQVTSVYRITVTMFATPGAEDMSVMLLLRDITAERRLDAMKEEFFQSVAHDLRAPLFAMQGYLRLLEKSLSPDKHQKGYLDAITQSCEKLTLFIQDTLDSARIEAGQLKLSAMPIDPRALLERAVKLFQPLAVEKGVKLELREPAEAVGAVDCDERLMERVFYNLLSNALKFTPRGGAITLGYSAAGAKDAEFFVADTGPGIPESQRTLIFEKYRQAEQPGATRSGFGLGLNICRKIVKLHGGTIWAESQPGKGSQFILRIPRKQQPQTQGERHASAKDG